MIDFARTILQKRKSATMIGRKGGGLKISMLMGREERGMKGAVYCVMERVGKARRGCVTNYQSLVCLARVVPGEPHQS